MRQAFIKNLPSLIKAKGFGSAVNKTVETLKVSREKAECLAVYATRRFNGK